MLCCIDDMDALSFHAYLSCVEVVIIPMHSFHLRNILRCTEAARLQAVVLNDDRMRNRAHTNKYLVMSFPAHCTVVGPHTCAVSSCPLQEYKQKLARVTQVRKELKSHIQSLPDLSLLPNVTGGLAPLPSAGDLFSTD